MDVVLKNIESDDVCVLWSHGRPLLLVLNGWKHGKILIQSAFDPRQWRKAKARLMTSRTAYSVQH